MRFTIELPLDLTKDQIEEIIMKDERTIKQLEGRTPNKVIIVPGKIINLVVNFKITIVKSKSNYWGLIFMKSHYEYSINNKALYSFINYAIAYPVVKMSKFAETFQRQIVLVDSELSDT
jgi:hypothetical protein